MPSLTLDIPLCATFMQYSYALYVNGSLITSSMTD